MTTSPPLTRYLGKAERTLQSLLQMELKSANFTFPEWTVLIFLSGSEPLDQSRLMDALTSGHLLDEQDAVRLIGTMTATGLIEHGRGGYRITEAASGRYQPLRERVMKITTALVDGIPAADLDATRRTLETVTRRAAARLEPSSLSPISP